MTYQEALDYLYTQLPMFQRVGASAYKKDLTNTLKLCEYLHQPQSNFPSIHIAGTNGKGSVSHMLASVLQESGLKVGLYTSPHLKSFTERIKVNGKEVDSGFITEFVSNHKSFFSTFDPSFFEITVAMAFQFFSNEKVDVAIIETGLGGRLDSTNVIQPMLSVITNIGFDHMQFLGNTLPEIAYEKAGIIKHKVPVVIGESHPETCEVFKKKASECFSQIYFAEDLWELENYEILHSDSQLLNVNLIHATEERSIEIQTDLIGNYQLKNIITVLASLDILKQNLNFSISDKHISNGLRHVVKNTGLKGRWQILNQNPLVIADTGHNKPGIECVMSQLKTYSYKNLRMVIGFVNDKDVSEMLKLFPSDAIYYFTKADIPRSMNESNLKEIASNLGLNGNSFSNVRDALNTAIKESEQGDLIFVGGSTFVVAEVV